MLNFVLSAAGGVACPEAEALLCGAVARGQPCHAPGRWRMHCPNTPPTARERFASKRIPGRSPGARVVLGNGGKALAGVGLRGWASIEGERQLNLADGCAWARVFAGFEGLASCRALALAAACSPSSAASLRDPAAARSRTARTRRPATAACACAAAPRRGGRPTTPRRPSRSRCAGPR